MEKIHRRKEKKSGGQRSDYHYLMAEMKAQNFDVIKFATYRTASKLRFIQKKTNMHLVDIWNIIEALRENSLNALESRLELTVPRLDTLVHTICHQLNKRIPLAQQLNVEHSCSVLVNWLVASYDTENTGKVRVFSIKVALAIICAGKITDKLRYIFTLIADVNGHMVFSKFVDFLREAMQLPCSVFESPSFFFTESLPRTIFDGQSTITVSDFLEILLSDPGPQCLMWFPLIHRMSSVENVLHSVQCQGCNKESFTGFRYKCQRCHNYHLCQDCFWRCRVSGNHTNQHEMKEYTSFKTPGKQLGETIKKSILCVPEKPANMESHYQFRPSRIAQPPQTLRTSSLPNAYNGAVDIGSFTLPLKSSLKQTHRRSSSDFYPPHEERGYMSNYNSLPTRKAGRYTSELNLPSDTARQRELIAKLEAKNKEIMREIIRLRQQKEEEDEYYERCERKPTMITELRALRLHKHDLDDHLSCLQESRRDLVLQLDALMRMLNDHSPLSSPTSSPLPSPYFTYPYYSSSLSAPATPGSYMGDPWIQYMGDPHIAYFRSPSPRTVHSDLLVAADSVTNAMSNLVERLNIDEEDDFYYDRTQNYADDLVSEYDLRLERESWPAIMDYENYLSADPYLVDAVLPQNGMLDVESDIYPPDIALIATPVYEPSHGDTVWDDSIGRYVLR